jgi:hypothetical protein
MNVSLRAGVFAASVLGVSTALLPITSATAAAPTPSTTFGGYQVNSTTATGISAVLKVPKVHCTKVGEAMQNGIVFNGEDNFGLFTSSSYSAVSDWSTCQVKRGHQVPAQNSLVIFLGNTQDPKQLTVKAGQKISMSIAYAAGKITVKAEDLTTKKKLSKTATVIGFSSISAQAGTQPLDGSNDAALPIPSFAKDTFSKVAVSGAKLGTATPVAYDMTRGSTELTKPSAITAKTTFHMSYVHH